MTLPHYIYRTSSVTGVAFECRLCNVVMTGPDPINAHVRGKAHINKARRAQLEPAQAGEERMCTAVVWGFTPAPTPEEGVVCGVCRVAVTVPELRNHLRDPAHQAAVSRSGCFDDPILQAIMRFINIIHPVADYSLPPPPV